MTNSDGRLMGWKAIAAFLGCEERTARRWAATRGLPVSRVPGGGSATVWADPDELRRWIVAGRGEQVAAVVADPVPVAAAVRKGRRRWPWALAGAGALAATAGLAVNLGGVPHALIASAGAAAAAGLPAYGRDAAANRLYREARYGLSRRSIAGLKQAEAGFAELQRRFPANPRAHVGMAETYLLQREFGAISNELGFRRAEAAAARAVALDPRSAAAARALGFARYFGAGERAEGLQLLERATRLDPRDTQSRHWYGTALLGEGRARDAIASLTAAQALEPGSSAIAADIAYATYLAGDHRGARAMLVRITSVEPEFSGAWRYLARIALIERRGDDYLDAAARCAALRRDGEAQAKLAVAAEAHASGGFPAMLAALIAEAERHHAQSGEDAVKVAMLHAVRGDAAAVRRWIGRAAATREVELRTLPGYLEFVPYRGDRVLQTLVQGGV